MFRKRAEQKESRVEEGHVMVDHVHRMFSIPRKLPVLHVVGYIKGRSAIHIARTYKGKQRNYVGQHFWARGYFVSTVGQGEKQIREYIRSQEKEDKTDCSAPVLRIGTCMLVETIHLHASLSWWQRGLCSERAGT